MKPSGMRMMPVQLRAVVTVLAISACGGAPKRSHGGSEDATVVLVDPGAEPRQRLAFALTPRVPELMETRLKFHLTSSSTNPMRHTSADLPTLKITSRLEVSSISAEGDAAMTSEVEDVAVMDDTDDPAIRKPLEAGFAAIKGLRVSWRMTPSGRVSGIVVPPTRAQAAMPAGIADLAEAYRGGSVTFPDAAIGVGAAWQVTSQHTATGVRWNLTVTYRLNALAGSTATVEARSVMRAPSQVLRVEPNATTVLTSGYSEETTEMTIPLHGLVATSTSRGTSETSFSSTRGRARSVSTVQTEFTSAVKALYPETITDERLHRPPSAFPDRPQRPVVMH